MNKSGILIIDKPKGPTSHDLVYKIRRKFKCKTGHAGTLDPLATGVMVILLESATKISSFLSLDDKEYIVTALLGVETDTLDSQGKIISENPVPSDLNENKILEILKTLEGEQMQIPPMFSAVKQNGKKLYELARKGLEVERTPRKINIYETELLSWKSPEIKIRIKCSKGTYIRQFISDFGKKTGCGAHVTALRRTLSGKFDLKKSYTLKQIENTEYLSDLSLISLSEALDHFDYYVCPEDKILNLFNGQKLEIDKTEVIGRNTLNIRILSSQGHLLALANFENGKLKPIKVFHDEFNDYFDTLPTTLNDRRRQNGYVNQ